MKRRDDVRVSRRGEKVVLIILHLGFSKKDMNMEEAEDKVSNFQLVGKLGQGNKW